MRAEKEGGEGKKGRGGAFWAADFADMETGVRDSWDENSVYFGHSST